MREEIVAHDGDEDTREAIDVITGTFNTIITHLAKGEEEKLWRIKLSSITFCMEHHV